MQTTMVSSAPIDPFANALPRTTDRLALRRFALGDLARFQSYRCEPEVGRYQGWSAMDNAGAGAFLSEMAEAPIGVSGAWFQIAVALRDTDALVGDIGIGFDATRVGVAEIGFSMAPSAQRRGLATEAVTCALSILFESGAVDVVEGITDARNAPSIKLMKRVGMQLARTQQAIFKGEPCTEQYYAIRRTDWEPPRRNITSTFPP